MAKKKGITLPVTEAEPEHFPRELLAQPPSERQRFFKRDCIIDHGRLTDACQQVLREVCVTGEANTYVRNGLTTLVIGPTRVGKTTLIRLIEQEMVRVTLPLLERNPGLIPFVSVTMAGPESGRFDWLDYYETVLLGLGDPFVRKVRPWSGIRDLRVATLEALKQRTPLAIIVDEAHHLAKHGNGRRLQDQMDVLKSIENETGVSHILVGTYDLRPFRSINPQLACRSVDIHFKRYDATDPADLQQFLSVLWAFQCLLPVKDEPALKDEHWQFLYGASLGCVGLLKQHLDRALVLALEEGEDTVTLGHLQQTITSLDRRNLALQAILEGEKELTMDAQQEEQWQRQLGLTPPKPRKKARTSPKNNRPFHRLPERDPIGMVVQEGQVPLQEVS